MQYYKNVNKEKKYFNIKNVCVYVILGMYVV